MTYTPNIPVTGDSLGNTRDRIRTNFQVISSTFDQNHIKPGDGGQGKHKFIQMAEVANSAAAPTTLANEAGFYARVGTNPEETNLWFRGENNGFQYQLTSAVSTGTLRFGTFTLPVPNNAGGWTFLPGGLILQYGRRLSPGSSGLVTFPIPFPGGTAPYSIQVSLERTTGSQNVTIDSGTPPTSTGFNYLASSGGSNAVNWIAIGK